MFLQPVRFHNECYFDFFIRFARSGWSKNDTTIQMKFVFSIFPVWYTASDDFEKENRETNSDFNIIFTTLLLCTRACVYGGLSFLFKYN